MPHFRNILEGSDIAEIRESEGGYNYFGFTRSNGTWVIMRETIATQTFRYAVGRSNFDANFTNRATLSYHKSDKWPHL